MSQGSPDFNCINADEPGSTHLKRSTIKTDPTMKVVIE
jgi:hypothetical protein